MSVLNNIILVGIGIALTLASLWYGQNHHLLPTAAALEAPLFDGLFNTTMVIATGVFLIVQGLLVFSAIRFRRKGDDNSDGPTIHGNVLLEIVWTAVPAVVILWLAVASLDVYQRIDSGVEPAGHAHSAPVAALASQETGYTPVIASTKDEANPLLPDLTVQVSGMQYAWLFTYPDTGVTTGELHLPLGKRVKLDMVAQDVNHAFWVPQYRLKQDLIPGRETHLEFTPTEVGEYPIVCAELCGPYHGAMRGQIIVESQDQFLVWQQSQVLAMKERDDQALAMQIEPSSPQSGFVAAKLQDLGIPTQHLQSIPVSHPTHHS